MPPSPKRKLKNTDFVDGVTSKVLRDLSQRLKEATEIGRNHKKKKNFWVRLWGWLIQFETGHFKLGQVVLPQVKGGDRSPLPALE